MNSSRGKFTEFPLAFCQRVGPHGKHCNQETGNQSGPDFVTTGLRDANSPSSVDDRMTGRRGDLVLDAVEGMLCISPSPRHETASMGARI